MLAFVVSACAGCVTKRQVIAFTNMNDFLRVCRVLDQAGGDYPETGTRALLQEWQEIMHRIHPDANAAKAKMNSFLSGFKEGWSGEKKASQEVKTEKSLSQTNKELTVKQAMSDGILIVFPPNTRVDRVEEFREYVSWVTIKGTKVLIPNEAVICD